MCILMTVPTFLGLGAGRNRDVTHRFMPQISICRSPETEPPEPLETRTLVVRRIFDEGQAKICSETNRRIERKRVMRGNLRRRNRDESPGSVQNRLGTMGCAV